MKTFYIFIIIALSISCNSSTEESSFTGNWKLVRSNEIFFNVCPKIKLVEVSRLESPLQSDELSALPGNKIVFSHENVKNYFSETEFLYRVIYEDNEEYLELFSIDKKNKYLLARDTSP